MKPWTIAALTRLMYVTSAFPSIEIAGPYFKNPLSGGEFKIVGISYQVSNSTTDRTALDALIDPGACLRDAALMQKLGINTIHVYSVDPTLSHDDCVSIFNAAGIYIFITLDWNSTGPSTVTDPAAAYTLEYMLSTFAIVDAFMDYENVLGFFVGHRVYEHASSLKIIPPFVRALLRDTKQYIAKNSARAIPVGIEVNFDFTNVVGDKSKVDYYNRAMWQYCQCTATSDTDPSRADFFGFPSLSWCPGNGTIGGTNGTFDAQWAASSWEDFLDYYVNTAIPVFFSDYGCINTKMPQDRDFHETSALYDYRYMAGGFAGGVLYQWANVQSEVPSQNWGLVNLDAQGSVQLRKDFDTFSNVLGQFNREALQADDFIIESSMLPPAPPCTPTLIASASSLEFPTSWILPTPPPGLQNLISFGNNGTRGQLVDVIQTSVTHVVKDVQGNTLDGLVITPSPSSPRTTTSSLPFRTRTSAGAESPSNSNTVKIAVGVAVPVGILALIALGFLLSWCMRRSREQERTNETTHGGESNEGKAEVEDTSTGGSGIVNGTYYLVAPRELDSYQSGGPQELGSEGHEVLELSPEQYGIQELEGRNAGPD